MSDARGRDAYEQAIDDRDTAFADYRDSPSDPDLETRAQIADDRAVELNADIGSLLWRTGGSAPGRRS